ncbi:unnamed protein product [Acanthosepion pharaonis]|uniref:Uncharacterized protein n=1 Tax=Acanthosepion pharaonis TaxID=158019 RepID=A0A812B847_ACAPH|nr:unnamed protein product [Sepia pharaonis]
MEDGSEEKRKDRVTFWGLFLLPLFLFSSCLGGWPTMKLKLLSSFLSSRCSSILFISQNSTFLSHSTRLRLVVRSRFEEGLFFRIANQNFCFHNKRGHLFHSKVNSLSRILKNTSIRPLVLMYFSQTRAPGPKAWTRLTFSFHYSFPFFLSRGQFLNMNFFPIVGEMRSLPPLSSADKVQLSVSNFPIRVNHSVNTLTKRVRKGTFWLIFVPTNSIYHFGLTIFTFLQVLSSLF